MKPRPKRNPKVRRETLLRDRGCCRCSYGWSEGPFLPGLECAHVVALADGGADDLCNTQTLCRSCHKDWHDFYEPSGDHDRVRADWEMFLETTPTKFLRAREWTNKKMAEIERRWPEPTMVEGYEICRYLDILPQKETTLEEFLALFDCPPDSPWSKAFSSFVGRPAATLAAQTPKEEI